MKVKTNVKAGGKRFPSIANWLIDSVKIIAFASFVVLAVAFGAPQRAQGLDVTIGSPGGQNVDIAVCQPRLSLLQVNFNMDHAGTWAVFRAAAYEVNSGQVVVDSWTHHSPANNVATGEGYQIRFLYPGAGRWKPFVEYYIWDGSSSQWLHGSYWVTFSDGSSSCGMYM
jgi:hypothetical protein